VVLAVEWGTGQVFWSILWFFLFMMWIWLIFVIFGDIVRSDDLSGWAKAIWSVFIIFLPYVGIFAYLIVRGGGMSARQARNARAAEALTQAYIRGAAGTATTADELGTLAELHATGKLDDAEYAAAKSRLLA
jgi:hypothetical protein